MGLKSTIRTFVIGAAAGAAAVYFKDPDRGDQRLEEFKEKASSTMSSLNQATDEAKDLAGQAADEARSLAGEAKDKADDLADDAKAKGQELANDARDSADDVADSARGSSLDPNRGGGLGSPGASGSTGADSLILPGERRL